jgi:hypothetical protein
VSDVFFCALTCFALGFTPFLVGFTAFLTAMVSSSFDFCLKSAEEFTPVSDFTTTFFAAVNRQTPFGQHDRRGLYRIYRIPVCRREIQNIFA